MESQRSYGSLLRRSKTGTSHDLFDPTTNPLGWRLMLSEATEEPATPMFFNASGTEGQLIAHETMRTRVQIRIIGGVASLETWNALGEGTRSTQVVNDRVYEADTTSGAPVGCGFSPECTAGPGTCLVDGQPRTLECTRQEIDATVNVRRTSDIEGDAIIWQRPTVVCVDYRGDEEVLCTLDAESTFQEQAEETVQWQRGFASEQQDSDCGLEVLNSTTMRDLPFVDSHGFLAQIHEKAILDDDQISQGYAVDAGGRVMASQTIWVLQPTGGYEAIGAWNFLTGGDLPTYNRRADAALRGKAIVLVPSADKIGNVFWECRGDSIPAELRPSRCR